MPHATPSALLFVPNQSHIFKPFNPLTSCFTQYDQSADDTERRILRGKFANTSNNAEPGRKILTTKSAGREKTPCYITQSYMQ
jgi:hypothetical protein